MYVMQMQKRQAWSLHVLVGGWMDGWFSVCLRHGTRMHRWMDGCVHGHAWMDCCLFVCLSVCLCVLAYACMRVCTCIRHTQVGVYACMRACMNVCVCLHRLTDSYVAWLSVRLPAILFCKSYLCH